MCFKLIKHGDEYTFSILWKFLLAELDEWFILRVPFWETSTEELNMNKKPILVKKKIYPIKQTVEIVKPVPV